MSETENPSDTAHAAEVFRTINEIGIINQLSSAELQRVLAPSLGQSEFTVLNHFMRVGDGTSPSRLARIFQMRKPSMTHIITKLQAKGFVEVRASAADKRAKTVHITPAGRTARDDAIAVLAPLIGEVAETLSASEVQTILPILEKLRTFLDARRNQRDQLNKPG